MKFTKEDFFIVTGASSGIGEDITIKLNTLGASVIAVARDENRLILMKSKCEHSKNIFLEIKDLTENIEGLPQYLKSLKDKYSTKFKGLVCVAGLDMPMSLQLIDYNDGKTLFDINYFAPIFLAKGFADRRVNTRDNSTITFVASTAGVNPGKGQTLYGASKAALIAASKSISKELSHQGIRVNCISPALVETPMSKKNEETIGIDLTNYSLGIGKPADISSMVAYLSSNEARWITGQNYILDGGAY